MEETKKVYLGDGVYIDICRFSNNIILTTEDGIDVLNIIYLEPEVYLALVKFVKENGGERFDTRNIR